MIVIPYAYTYKVSYGKLKTIKLSTSNVNLLLFGPHSESTSTTTHRLWFSESSIHEETTPQGCPGPRLALPPPCPPLALGRELSKLEARNQVWRLLEAPSSATAPSLPSLLPSATPVQPLSFAVTITTPSSHRCFDAFQNNAAKETTRTPPHTPAAAEQLSFI